MVEISLPRLGLQGFLSPPKPDCLPDHPELLDALAREETTSIHHLERSNKELLTALEAGEDSDYRTALQENMEILRMKRSRLAEIRAKLRHEMDHKEGHYIDHLDCSTVSMSSPFPRNGLDIDGFEEVACTAAGSSSGPDANVLNECVNYSVHEVDSTVTKMDSLLRSVKRKAFELEEEVAAANSHAADLTLPSTRLRTAPDESSREPVCFVSRATSDDNSYPVVAGGVPDKPSAVSPTAQVSITAAASDSPQEDNRAPDDQGLDQSLRRLLRRLKRKASELEENVITGGLRSLSVSDPEQGQQHPTVAQQRPHTRPRNGLWTCEITLRQ